MGTWNCRRADASRGFRRVLPAYARFRRSELLRLAFCAGVCRFFGGEGPDAGVLLTGGDELLEPCR